MSRLKRETFGAGDQSWLGSARDIWNGRTETLDISAFTRATHFPDGFVPSGTPVAKVGGLLVPYDSTEATTTNAGVLAGVTFADCIVGTDVTSAAGDLPVAILDTGRIKAAKVKTGVQAFTAPVAAAKRASTTFVFI